MFTLTGTIKEIGQTQNISDKFQKRELIITEKSGPYEQPIMFEATQDRTNLFDGLNVGEEVSVQFHIRGREWKSPRDGQVKHFISLNAYRVDRVGQAEGAAPPPPSESDIPADLSEDDLPF